MHPDLDPYQRVGAQWLASQITALLCDGPGMGKTPQAVAACDLVGAKNVLVTVPGIGRLQWAKEFARWQTTERTIAPILATTNIPEADVNIVSYSLLQQPAVCKYLLSRRWDVIINDEAHYLKGTGITSQVAYGTAFDSRTGVSSLTSMMWGMTGTVMPNGPHELWTHCRAMFPDVVQGRSYRQWVARYCVTKRGSDKVIGVNKTYESELISLIKPHILRRRSEDVGINLPPLRFAQVVVRPEKLPPTPPEMLEAVAIVRAAIAEAYKQKDPEAMAAILAAEAIHLTTLRKFTGIVKAPAVADYINEQFAGGLESAVIFAVHRDVISILEKAIPGSVSVHGGTSAKDADRFVNAFEGRDPGFRPRAIIIQLQKGAEVLNLTSCSYVAFAENDWTPKNVQQAAKRCHRRGQSRPVLASLFSLAGSVDEDVESTLVRKLRDITRFDNAVTTTFAG